MNRSSYAGTDGQTYEDGVFTLHFALRSPGQVLSLAAFSQVPAIGLRVTNGTSQATANLFVTCRGEAEMAAARQTLQEISWLGTVGIGLIACEYSAQ
ncbi:MAG: hypothetical protein IJ043_08470 [Clostridia bacterium]|nr:hypothetical protein [Clostridia bacterium]